MSTVQTVPPTLLKSYTVDCLMAVFAVSPVLARMLGRVVACWPAFREV